MTPTRPWTLALCGLIGLAVGWLLEVALVSWGRPAVVTPIPLAAFLVVLAVAVVAVAVPVRRVAKGRPGAKVDPFYATRVVVLAQASALTGAILTGGTIGMLLFLVTRPVVSSSTILPGVLGCLTTIALLVAGVVAEQMCRIPPGNGPDDEAIAPTEEH
jgi:uncharacterized membrane protein